MKARQGYKLVDWHWRKKREVPKEWDVVLLKNLIDILPGFSFSSDFFHDENGTPLIRIRDLPNMTTTIRYNGKYDDCFVVREGDLLIGMDGEFKPYLWKGKDALLNQRVCKLTTKNEASLNQTYLYYAIGKELAYYELINVGTTVGHISVFDIKKINLPLSRISEQQKIASILSNVDAQIQQIQKLIDLTQRLKKGLMQNLLTRGIGHTKFKKVSYRFKRTEEIPSVWDVTSIGQISKKLLSGGTPDTKNEEYWNGDIPWTRGAMLTEHYISEGEAKITKEGYKNSSSVIIKKNNLLISSRVSLGNISINRIDIAINQDATGIILDKSKASEEYLYWLLLEQMYRLTTISQGTSIQGFIRKDLERLKIPLPPLEEQQKIVSIISNVDEQINQHKNEKALLERIKKGLMQQLLTGQRRVKVGV